MMFKFDSMKPDIMKIHNIYALFLKYRQISCSIFISICAIDKDHQFITSEDEKYNIHIPLDTILKYR